MEGLELVEAWRQTIQGAGKSWVLFENGTCVVLMAPEANLAAQATALLREWGPVHAGSSAGDFTVVTLDNGIGWVVTSHHNDILTLVGRDELSSEPAEVLVGLYGRGKRAQDAEELRVVHVENPPDRSLT